MLQLAKISHQIQYMPKSNRKGYFVMQLRKEGLEEEAASLQSSMRGIRKQPKIAAREARERKKIYIEHLEGRISQMSSQIQKLTKQNYQFAQQCQNLKYLISQSKKEVDESKNKMTTIMETGAPKASRFQGLLKQIGNLSINLQNNNKFEVARSLSVLRDKFGISGRERLRYIDEQFDKIISITMPLHFRLLMQNVANNRQFYTLLGSQYNNKSLVKLEDRERQILVNVRPQIMRHREEYDKLITSMAQVRTKIKTLNYRCQAIVDEIEDKVDPMFVGRLLLDLDFCRFRQNLDSIYPTNYWNRVKDDVFDLVVPVKKPQNYSGQQRQSLFRFQDDLEIFNQLFS